MISVDTTKHILAIFKKNWPGGPPWLPVFGIALLTAGSLIVPGALIEIVAETGDKIWIAIFSILIATIVLACAYLAVYRSLLPIAVPAKSLIHIFIPATGKGSSGDAFLQYAGFTAAVINSNNTIELKFYDSSLDSWLVKMQECITETPEDNPVWIVITMSQKGIDARKILDNLLRRDPRLKERLTVFFTVASSRFDTLDRKNMFRLFVDGEAEAIVISREIQKIIKNEDSAEIPILYYHVESQYGTDVLNKLKGLLTSPYHIKPCQESDLSGFDINDYKIIVVVAYDQGLRNLFNVLNKSNYSGEVFGTTTLSVPGWQKQWDFDGDRISVMHTAVNGFEENEEYCDRLNGLTFDTIVNIDYGKDKIFASPAITEMYNDRVAFDANKDIENNYISAFCADCIHLLALAIDQGYTTFRALLDDPRMDEERHDITIIRDLDFGVTGDAHVSVFMRHAEKRKNAINDAGGS